MSAFEFDRTKLAAHTLVLFKQRHKVTG
jgi:hypothetical protein